MIYRLLYISKFKMSAVIIRLLYYNVCVSHQEFDFAFDILLKISLKFRYIEGSVFSHNVQVMCIFCD